MNTDLIATRNRILIEPKSTAKGKVRYGFQEPHRDSAARHEHRIRDVLFANDARALVVGLGVVRLRPARDPGDARAGAAPGCLRTAGGGAGDGASVLLPAGKLFLTSRVKAKHLK